MDLEGAPLEFDPEDLPCSSDMVDGGGRGGKVVDKHQKWITVGYRTPPALQDSTMVLKNSKWDKKAKYKYMKKHDILPSKKKDSEEDVQRPKWSSKKKTVDTKDKIVLEDSEDEWDSDVDDALINHFYPQLSENEELTIEHKIKIKQQILKNLEEQEDEQGEDTSDKDEQEPDDIYLGSEENKQKEMQDESKPPVKFNLQEFINNLDVKPKKNRKMLSNKMSDNFLEEYGLSSYKDLNRTTDDYNDVYVKKQQEKLKTNINYIPNETLDGFVIGQSSLDVVGTKATTKSHIRNLTEEEKQEDEERQKLVRQEQRNKLIKKRFDETRQQQTKAKVLDINNFNNEDSSQLAYLNEKITRDDGSRQTDLDDDLDVLLGSGSKSKMGSDKPGNADNFDDFMNTLSIDDNKSSKTQKLGQPLTKPKIEANKDLDFLDDLLGGA
ncbi:hypothetical protein Cantr_07222 [Candida viswanathii]|uniref:Uncharacterized protein n=1 Tax=Candida viswanathii TaxID=5486 RepID=A0A367XYM4_9ASCO|nr:hypothetical protein Cantr_07222 [Candida viswanathii]